MSQCDYGILDRFGADLPAASGEDMKKRYEKPALVRREVLSRVTAQEVTSPADVNGFT